MEHWDAWCYLWGSLLGALGGLYLTFDILGGKNGPLAGVTRIVTYIALFCIFYGFGLGLRFGLIASLGMGVTLGLDFELESRRLRLKKKTRHWMIGLFMAFSYALSLSLGLMSITNGGVFLFVFPLYAAFMSGSYFLGFAPGENRKTSKYLKFRASYFWLSVIRGLGGGFCYWAGISLISAMTGQTFSFISPGRVALTIGGGSYFVGLFTPSVEWWVERFSQRWLAVVGVTFAIFGFLIQAFPNWVILLK